MFSIRLPGDKTISLTRLKPEIDKLDPNEPDLKVLHKAGVQKVSVWFIKTKKEAK